VKIRRKAQGQRAIKKWLVDNQIRISPQRRGELTLGIPVVGLSVLVGAHAFVDQPYTAKFFSLSHFNSSTQLYNKGPGDWPFVITWVLVFTFARAALMDYIFYPFFHRFAPHPTRRTATRFAEQAWNLSYYTISFSVGLYITLHSPYWGDMREVWAGYPQIESDGFFKAYYLVEMAFWIQQVIVLNIEARRKDFWQMLCHHIVTCTLIFMSYTYNTTRVGNLILSTMDFSDILLSVTPPPLYPPGTADR
jgi:very-long-chain ceramide synthase